MGHAFHPGFSGTTLGRGTGDLNHNGIRGDRGDLFRDAHSINRYEARHMGLGNLHCPPLGGFGLGFGAYHGYPLAPMLRAETALMRAQTNFMVAGMAGQFLTQLLGGMGA